MKFVHGSIFLFRPVLGSLCNSIHVKITCVSYVCKFRKQFWKMESWCYRTAAVGGIFGTGHQQCFTVALFISCQTTDECKMKAISTPSK